MANKFGISCSYDGWFIERHPKLDPVATMTDGIFIRGACQGPKEHSCCRIAGAAAARGCSAWSARKTDQAQSSTCALHG